jgi:Mn-dependent DtxR family transcriptional regulator
MAIILRAPDGWRCNMDRQVVAAHVLKEMALARREDRQVTLDSLTATLGIRRADVRAALSSLHEEGLLDVLRMRLTMDGFALGTALAERKLHPLMQLRRRVAAA